MCTILACVGVYRNWHQLLLVDVGVFYVVLVLTGYKPLSNTIEWVQTHPVGALLVVLGYLFAGVVWATLKWKLHLQKLRAEYDAWLSSSKKVPETDFDLPYELKGQGMTVVSGKRTVDVAKFKSRIIGWLAYWPISIVLWFIGDFLADVFNQIYRMVRRFFQGMADREFR